MKIIKPHYIIETPINGIEILKTIERIGRRCYKSEDKITEESAPKFVKMIIDRGHEAMLEHGGMISICFIVDRGVSHEMVRHRICSFAQESTRYCNYSKDKFGSQITITDLSTGFKYNFNNPIDIAKYNVWTDACEYAEKAYFQLISLGAVPQEARSVLPTSTKTEIVISTNPREWREIFKLRVPQSAHPQMREVMIPLLKELQDKIPVLFDDIQLED